MLEKITMRMMAGGVRSLLVVETDRFSLRAAIVCAKDEKVWIKEYVETRVRDFSSGLGLILDRLREKLGVLPRQAIVLTPEATATTLDLPVNPAQPRPFAQMQEMIRWELESQSSSAASAPYIGDIAMARKYLIADHVRWVLDVQTRRKQENINPVPRFGELAVELGFLKPTQIDECRSLQEQFREVEGDGVFGWTGSSTTPDGESKYRWLVSAINRHARDRWTALFQAQGLELQGIYPLVGSSSALLKAASTQTRGTIVEIQPLSVGIIGLANGRVCSLKVQSISGGFPGAAACADMLDTEEWGPLWLTGWHPQLRDLARQLANRLKREVKVMEIQTRSAAPPEASAGILGAASHALGLAEASRVAPIAVRDPAPAFWQRWQTLALAGCLFLALGIALVEAYHRPQLQSAQEAQARVAKKHQFAENAAFQVKGLAAEAKKLEEGNAKLDRQLDEARQQRAFLEAEVRKRGEHALDEARQRHRLLETELTRQTNDELKETRTRHVFLDTQLPRHSRTIASLLEAMARSPSKDITVTRVTTGAKDEVRIQATANSEPGAQKFAQALAADLSGVDLVVIDLRVALDKARNALSVDLLLGRAPSPKPREVNMAIEREAP